MVGKLLSMDVKDKGIIISIIHPGFMRTEMTAGVGFDKYWDDGGGEFTTLRRWIGLTIDSWIYTNQIAAVTPDEAAKTLIDWAEKLDMSKSGEYWAPRGPRKFCGTIDFPRPQCYCSERS